MKPSSSERNLPWQSLKTNVDRVSLGCAAPHAPRTRLALRGRTKAVVVGRRGALESFPPLYSPPGERGANLGQSAGEGGIGGASRDSSNRLRDGDSEGLLQGLRIIII